MPGFKINNVCKRAPSFYPYSSGLLHWHWGNGIVLMPVEQPWRIWVKSFRTEPEQNRKKRESRKTFQEIYSSDPLQRKSATRDCLTEAHTVKTKKYRSSHTKIKVGKMYILRCMGSKFCVNPYTAKYASSKTLKFGGLWYLWVMTSSSLN